MFLHNCATTAIISGATLLALSPMPVRAEQTGKVFNISSGPAFDSIADFGTQAELNILATGENLKGITTNEVRGCYGVDEALKLLLAGTGLSTRINANGSVFISSSTPRPRDNAGTEPWEKTMTDSKIPSQRKATYCAVSAAILLMAPPLAQAQGQAQANDQATNKVPAKPNETVDDDIRQVLVVGQRASQQSAIQRKKNASTSMESLVADDVGSMPDSNIAEAVSRMSGVTLNRGDYGEGQVIQVRGVGNEETRVEMDGMVVASAGGSSLNGNEGRSADLRDLPAELISSIDVIKGATADMTEGSLGGSVVIKTRTGLDFKKRMISVRASSQLNTVNEKVSPNLNLIFADKYLDNRLGLVANFSKSRAQNESHRVSATSTTNNALERSWDLDNSPEKTYSLNPAALDLNQAASVLPLPLSNGKSTTYAVNDGGTPFANHSAQEIITRSAAAQAKADCFAAFPLDDPAFNRISAVADKTNAQRTRANELRSCLNQWNDYTPGNVRYLVSKQKEDRFNGDLRLDYKVSDNLSIYAKVNRSNRDVLSTSNQLQLGNIANRDTSPVDGTTPMYSEAAGTLTQPALRTTNAVGVAQGYSFFPAVYGLRNNNTNGTFPGLYNGTGLTLVPGSLEFSNHQLTGYTLTNALLANSISNAVIHNQTRTNQFGGNWHSGGFKADFMWGVVRGDFWRYDLSSTLSFRYGPTNVHLNKDGLYEFDSSGQNNPIAMQTDLSNYGVVSATNARGQLRSTTNLAVSVGNVIAGENKEENLKLNMSYAVGNYLPILKTLKFGTSRRDYESSAWNSQSNQVISPAQNGMPQIFSAAQSGTNTIQACETVAVPGSVPVPCPYGFTAVNKVGPSGAGTYVVTQDDYRKYVQAGLRPASSKFLNGASISLPGVPGWTEFDAAAVYQALGQTPVDVNCIKYCVGNDGKVYPRPITRINEKVEASFLSTDFTFDTIPFTDRHLPFDWELEGNFGWRLVRSKVAGTGSMTFTAITTNPGWNRDTNNNDVTQTTYTKNVTLARDTTDVMPVLNLALWPVPNKVVVRYNRSKSIARPPIGNLVSSGITCTYDERNLIQANQNQVDLSSDDLPNSTCNGTVGNPALRAKTNINQDLSLEWYPNKDTSVSFNTFYQKGTIGGPRLVSLTNQHPFADSDIGLANGRSLAEVPYAYNTYEDGQANNRRGLEASGRTAFTFLPGILRYTGFNANYSVTKADLTAGAPIDFQTGDTLRPQKEYEYTWNTALWFDNGRLNARVALQVTGRQFVAFGTATGTNNFPTTGTALSNVNLPLQPQDLIYKDPQRYLDAKVSYKFANGIQFILEGRNLLNRTLTYSQGNVHNLYGNALVDTNYTGRRLMASIVFSKL
jgi:TonB-dependent receptor